MTLVGEQDHHEVVRRGCPSVTRHHLEACSRALATERSPRAGRRRRRSRVPFSFTARRVALDRSPMNCDGLPSRAEVCVVVVRSLPAGYPPRRARPARGAAPAFGEASSGRPGTSACVPGRDGSERSASPDLDRGDLRLRSARHASWKPAREVPSVRLPIPAARVAAVQLHATRRGSRRSRLFQQLPRTSLRAAERRTGPGRGWVAWAC